MQHRVGQLMQIIRKISCAGALCLLSCILCTCGQPLQENTGGSSRTVTVYFSGNSRAAIPVLPKDVCYKITAVSGTNTFSDTITDGSTFCNLELPGSTGDVWTITVNAYSQADPNLTLLTGSTTFALPQKTVTVSLSYMPDVTGDVALKINVDSVTCVTNLVISGTGTAILDGEYTVEGSTITIEKNGIDAGTYDALFSFYNASGVLIARCRETINVRGNFITDTWITAGDSILINSGGEFNLTPEAVETLTSTTLYVKGSTGGTLVDNGSDSNPGTWKEPFATLQAAVNRVIALNNAQSADDVAYTVFIDGKISYTTPDTSNPVDMAVINPGKTLNLTIRGMNSADSLTVTASRILYIGANASVTVKNLTLTGGNGASTLYNNNDNGIAGGGVYVDGGTFTLDSGGVITGCSAGIGGGIAVGPNGTFTMNGGTIGGSKSYDETDTDKTDMGNKATGSGGGVWIDATGSFTMEAGENDTVPQISGNTAVSGGGIYVLKDGTFTMNGGTISGNNSSENGGGVWNNGTFEMTGGIIGGSEAYAADGDKTDMGNRAGAFEKEAYGGGVYSKGAAKLNMSGGIISGNVANDLGGGMYIKGTGEFNMSGTAEISGNTAGDGSTAKDGSTKGKGGGVYISSGHFTMTPKENSTGSTDIPQISGNVANNSGGGVYFEGDTTTNNNFTMEAGVISGNKAGNDSTAGIGGGVYVGGNTFEMSGSAQIAGNSATNGGGVCVNGSEFTMNGGTIGGTISNGNVYNANGDADSKKNMGNSAGTHGGGIYVCGTGAKVSLAGGTIGKNSANTGGGVYAGGTGMSVTLTIKGSTIDSNEVNENGGGVYVADNVTFNMSSGKVTNNTASTGTNGFGGGVRIAGGSDKKFSGGEISGNKAKNGGGIYASVKIILSGVAVTGNTATVNGGGVHLSAGSTTYEMTGGTVSGNKATDGGGVYIGGGTFTMSGGTIGGTDTGTGNIATTDGGGVYVPKDCTFSMSAGKVAGNTAPTGLGGGVHVLDGGTFGMSGTAEISGNTANFGGGVYTAAGLTLSGSVVIKDNKASMGEGGGVLVTGGTFGMTGGTISGNKATDGGGVCLFISNDHTMTGGTISGNTATGNGGGVYMVNRSKFTMSGSSNITGNSADGTGGGVCVSSGTFTMSETTAKISGNTATSGGGVCTCAGGTFGMSAGTISGNAATGNGGGVYVNAGTFNMTGGTIGGSAYYSTSATDKTNMGNSAASSAQGGGGVYMSGGTFNMTGGSICGNTAPGSVGDNGRGGGVYMSGGTFTMSTETGTTATPHIFGNTVDWDGGGVYMNGGTFTMYNSAKVSGNNAARKFGGGVYVNSGTFYMKGGTVGGSKVYAESDSADDKKDMGNRSWSGGGVYVTGTCEMSAGRIEFNTAGTDGGGVSVNTGGNFTMSGTSSICNNTAKGSNDSPLGGGGVMVSGTFTMENGSITGNTAPYGGGVWNSNSCTIKGGSITGNTAESSGANVYKSGGTFTSSVTITDTAP